MNSDAFKQWLAQTVSELRSCAATGVLVGVVAFLALPAAGQEAAAPVDDGAKDGVTLASVEAELSEINADTGLDDTAKNLLVPKYKRAIELLQEAQDFDAKAEEYRQAIDTAPQRSKQYRAELQALPDVDQVAQATPPETMDALHQEIESRKTELQRLNDELARVSRELARVTERPPEISSRLPEVQRELAEINTQLASPEFSGEVTSPGRRAERILLQARRVKLLSELEMLNREQSSQLVRETMLQAQQKLLSRQVKNAEAAIDTLDELYRDQLSREAQHISSLADAIPKNLPEDDAAVQSLASEVQSWATEFDDVVTQLSNVTEAHDRTTSQLNDLTREYEDIQSQLDLGSHGRAMTQYLLDLRRRLPDPETYMARRSPELPGIDEARLKSLQVDNALREQPDVESRFADRSSDAVAQLVEIRGEVLTKLQGQYRNLIREQAALQAKQQQYLDQVSEVRTYVFQKLFWMQSSPPLGLASFTEIPAGLQWIFRGEHWVELGQVFRQTLARAPWSCLGFLLAISALLIARGRIAAALTQTGIKIRRVSTDRYSHTLAALTWTLLLAAPIPLVIGFAAWAFGQSLIPSDWLRGVRYGLRVAAWCAFAATFFAEACRPGGLGAAHFGWQKDVLARIRQAIFWIAIVYIPAFVLTVSCVVGDASHYFDSVGRISFILAHIWLTLVLWRQAISSHGVFATLASDHPTSRAIHRRRRWFLLLATLPVALALLAAAGYVIATLELALELLATVGLIAGGEIFYCLLLRWFTIRHRRLALAESLEKRRARQEEAASARQLDESSELVSVEPEAEDELDLEAVTEQTRHVLRLLVTLLVAIAVALSWSGTFPLLQFLDTVQVPLVSGLTLLKLCQVLLVLGITGVVARNLPGLLELVALRATTIKSGTRIAISTLAQYAVIAIGLALALNLLDVDWAAFGWIAAALSVGLGFGLQEVVANFVCGLILLFERPIRVGDIVTVEGTTGTVTRIHMRATTIINWDRQEFVVPNKTLITNTILNWTLNTMTNRVTVTVGVAYGSDTERARQILLDIAAEHPNVLEDPAPLASFEEFGDSTLTLRLRAYIPDMDNYLKTTSELHTKIDNRFAEAGIEIAFPQRDLHLRSGWEGLRRSEMQTFAESE